MENQYSFVRIIATALMLFTGLNAVIAGLMFIADPSGTKMGMSTDYLHYSPFSNFLIPGIILFLLLGIFNMLGSLFVLKQVKHHELIIVIQGVILCGWIIVQVLLVRDINPLHIIMLSIGLALLVCANIEHKKHHVQA